MRSDLKAVDVVSDIETDLDTQTSTFKVEGSVDVEDLLNKLAEKNNKISEWKFSD